MRGGHQEDRSMATIEHVRVCGECQRAKTIRGVWYLIPARLDVPFVCEACYGVARTMRAVV